MSVLSPAPCRRPYAPPVQIVPFLDQDVRLTLRLQPVFSRGLSRSLLSHDLQDPTLHLLSSIQCTKESAPTLDFLVNPVDEVSCCQLFLQPWRQQRVAPGACYDLSA